MCTQVPEENWRKKTAPEGSQAKIPVTRTSFLVLFLLLPRFEIADEGLLRK